MKLKLTGKKVCIFNGEVTKKSARNLILNIFEADLTKGDIYLVLNSCGGDAEGGTLIYKTLKNSLKNKLITVAAGEVASAATLIFLAGDKRLVYPGSTFYVHAGSFDGGFNMSETKTFFKSIVYKEKDMVNIYAQNSTISKKKWAKIIQKSRVLTAKQMLKTKLATELIEA
jgi:ATP-dependent Clp protease, protease subunit